MTERTNIAKSIAEAKCLGSLVAIDTAHKAGELTDAERDRLLEGLVPLHEAHNREVAELVRLVCEPPVPKPLHDWDFRHLAPGTLPVGWRCYGTRTDFATVSNERWGQNGGRTGWYRGLVDLRWTDDGLVMPWEPDPRGGLRCGYLTTGYGGPVIPALCRVEFDGYWTHGTRGLWAALGWLCASDGGAGRAEVDVSEYLPAHSLTGVSHVLHGRVAGETRYNFGTRYLKRRSNSYVLPAGVDLVDPHTHWFEARPEGGTVRLSWGIDEHTMESFTHDELLKAGVDWTLPQGWTIDSCTESEGNGGGKLDPTYKGGASMTLQAVRVWDLTGEGK